MNIVDTVKSYILNTCGVSVSKITPIKYVALSGGPDSVALLHILKQIGINCTALHCNFHLRGEESNRDYEYCIALCEKLNIPLQVKHFDTFAYMKEHNMSLEMAARELRYNWWNELLNDTDGLIALGHHMDDSIENMLMNMMRGTGINGMTGIVPVNKSSHVIRPLLCVTRNQIIEYLEQNNIDYVIDSTNLENDTLRNQIRNQLIPVMENILPSAKCGMVKTMQNLKECSDIINNETIRYHYDNAIINSIGSYTFEIIKDVNKSMIYPLTQYYKSNGYNVVMDKSNMLALPLYDIPESPEQWNVNIIDVNEAEIGKYPYIAYFDCNVINKNGIKYRRWKDGDKIKPFGMHGNTKLLSDIFSNKHMTSIEKKLVWVITDADDNIIWVPGVVQSEFGKVTSNTNNVIKIECDSLINYKL